MLLCAALLGASVCSDGALPQKFVAAEQKSGTISVYYDRPGREPQLQWAWSAKGDPNVKPEHHRLFGVPDECKPHDGGRLVLMNDSLGGFAGLDVGTGRCKFYGNAGGNPHSVELLPDGNVAVASSTGRTLKIFNVKEHPFDPDSQQCVIALDLPGGHGVVWDAKRGTLFALGYTNLYELAYAPETMSVKVLHRWDYTNPCVDAWGHDLLPDGKGGYYFTNHAAVWHFDPGTGVFAKARSVENVKSISLSPDGDMMAIPRERWWTDTLLVFPSGSSDASAARGITLPGAKFYKARWMPSGSEPNISVFAKFVRMTAKERGVSLAEAADMLYAVGVRGYDCGPDEPDLDELAATKLKPINFYYFPDWFNTDIHDWERGYTDRTKPAECLAKAKRYGIPRIMVVPPNFTDGKESETRLAQILAFMKGFVAEAKKQGITITIEDFGGTANPCSYAKYLKRFLDEIPDIRFALDTGNLYYAGRGDDILEMMAYAKGRIGHVHLKDQPADKNRSYVTLGLGAVPNEKIVKAVNAAGYDGWYTLEEPVGDTYADTFRQVAVLKAWLSGK